MLSQNQQAAIAKCIISMGFTEKNFDPRFILYLRADVVES